MSVVLETGIVDRLRERANCPCHVSYVVCNVLAQIILEVLFVGGSCRWNMTKSREIILTHLLQSQTWPTLPD